MNCASAEISETRPARLPVDAFRPPKMLGERKVPGHAVLGDDTGPFCDDLDGVVAVVVEEVVDAA